MKKALIVSLGTTIFLVLINFSLSFSYYYVCIDPGHGGSDSATVGPVYRFHEKDANLTVGLILRDKIQNYIYPVYMTRTIDTTIFLYDRARMANTVNGGGPVNYFISVHHNASADTSVNGTETYYCNSETTGNEFGNVFRGFEGMYGARDSTFAKKVRLALRDSLQHRYRCSPQSLCGDTSKPCCMKCFYVLLNTTMASVLSEASFITNPWVEYQFYAQTGYIDKEAGAICKGWWSSYLMGGLGIVKNAYSTGLGCDYKGLVGVGDLYCYIDTLPSPYEACWGFLEHYCLKAITPQYLYGYWYTFHHWTHFLPSGEPWETYYEPLWEITVPPEFDFHKYAAFFTGGPYSAELVSPEDWAIWHVEEQREIVFNVSIGADSTSIVYIYLDRNSGNSGYPEYLGARTAKLGNSFPWTVTGPYSTHCRIKIVTEDVAGNSAWDVSDEDFSISDSGNNNPVIDTGLHYKYPQTECNHCIHYGDSVTLEVHAHDPDGDSMYYEWYACCGFFTGHFSNGYDTMTTAQNYVVYTAPAKAGSPALQQAQGGNSLALLTVPEQSRREQSRTTEGGEGENLAPEVYLRATAIDVRGGRTLHLATWEYMTHPSPAVAGIALMKGL
jgi:N-acetylmuramoyl-L-alanine amidase